MLAEAVLALALAPPPPRAEPVAAVTPLVCIDPGHSANGANLETEPIGPGSTRRKIKDGGAPRARLRSSSRSA